jgi:hypothetical protein
MEVPEHVDEFERAGVTKEACIDAPCPRVAESPAHFECRYLSTHRLRGSSNHGTVDVVYGEVVRIHIRDEVLTPDGRLNIPLIKPIARLGYYEYVRVAVSGGRTDFNPVYELQAGMRTLCNDLGDRAQAVNQAVANGISAKPHPGRLPRNIY